MLGLQGSIEKEVNRGKVSKIEKTIATIQMRRKLVMCCNSDFI